MGYGLAGCVKTLNTMYSVVASQESLVAVTCDFELHTESARP